MFRIKAEEKNGLSFYQISGAETGAYIRILPEYGCALNNFVVVKDGKPLELMDGYTDAQDLKQWMYTYFKGHFLFPFPNRIFHGLYAFKGKHYQLRKNFEKEGNAIHGLLYDQPFKLKEARETEKEGFLSFSTEMHGEYEGFPFPCTVTLEFTFTGKKLSVTSDIVNTGSVEMPATLGWHPYFTTGKDISALVLEIPDCEQWHPESMGFTPVNQFSGKEALGSTTLDTCYRLNRSRTLLLKDPQAGVTLSLEPGKDLRYFQLFTPPHRKSIAIEPMSCVPDSFNNKIGFKSLSPGERWVTGWSVEILSPSSGV